MPSLLSGRLSAFERRGPPIVAGAKALKTAKGSSRELARNAMRQLRSWRSCLHFQNPAALRCSFANPHACDAVPIPLGLSAGQKFATHMQSAEAKWPSEKRVRAPWETAL